MQREQVIEQGAGGRRERLQSLGKQLLLISVTAGANRPFEGSAYLKVKSVR